MVCPHSSQGPATKPYSDEHWKQVHPILGQVRLGKTRLIPHLGCSIMPGCHNKWMVFWSGHGTALALGRSSEEQLHPTILPWPGRRWEAEGEEWIKKSSIITYRCSWKPWKQFPPPLNIPKTHIFSFYPSKYGFTVFGIKAAVWLSIARQIFPLNETCFKRKGFKEVTEMRNKRGKSSDQ